LKEPFSLDSAEKISRIESLNENVMTYFEGKGLPCIIDRSVKDVSRIMRLPGSVNFKYDEPVTSKIVGGSNGQILIA
jgi:hypothetical protein